MRATVSHSQYVIPAKEQRFSSDRESNHPWYIELPIVRQFRKD